MTFSVTRLTIGSGILLVQTSHNPSDQSVVAVLNTHPPRLGRWGGPGGAGPIGGKVGFPAGAYASISKLSGVPSMPVTTGLLFCNVKSAPSTSYPTMVLDFPM